MRCLGFLFVITMFRTAVDGQLSIAANSSFSGIVSNGLLQVNVSFSSWGGLFNNTYEFPTGKCADCDLALHRDMPLPALDICPAPTGGVLSTLSTHQG